MSLLREDAVQSMPPFAMWIQGASNIGRFMVEPGPSACRGSRLLATSANGCPAFGQYKPDPAGGYAPWALQILEISGGKIAGLSFFLAFLDPERLFAEFGLPLHLDAQTREPEERLERGRDLRERHGAAGSPHQQRQAGHGVDRPDAGGVLSPKVERGDS